MIDRLNNVKVSKTNNDEILNSIKAWEKRCYYCLDDDFNTPMLIAEIFNSSKLINKIEANGNCGDREREYFLNLFDSFLNKILGLNYTKSTSDNDSILEILLNIRDEARSKKDFQLSDSIRDQLNKIGIQINDKD